MSISTNNLDVVSKDRISHIDLLIEMNYDTHQS